jgi:small multidrug resistance pump
VAAILLEVAGTTSMKLSDGFARLGPSVAIFVFYGLAFVLLTLALKSFDVSLAYAVWSGLGVAVISLVGILYFQEPVTALKVGSLLLIVAGVAGLNAGGAH